MIKVLESLNIGSMFEEIPSFEYISSRISGYLKGWYETYLIKGNESFMNVSYLCVNVTKSSIKYNLPPVIYALTIFFSFTYNTYSQEDTQHTCNQDKLQEQHYNTQYLKYERKTQNDDSDEMLALPVTLQIVRKTNGETTYDLNDFLNRFPNGFATVNASVLSLNIRFYLKEIKFIDSDYLFNKTTSRADYVNYLDLNSTNVFIVNKGGNFSSFPNSNTTPNAIFFNKNVFGIDSNNVHTTLPHEVGHYFGLMHTHTSTVYGNTFVLAENVARNGEQSNCESSGDYLCSTPADPYNSNDSSDRYGNPYSPAKENLMSYYNAYRNTFTQEQYQVMRNALEYRLNDDRYNLSGEEETNEEISAPENLTTESTILHNEISWTNSSSNLGYIIERADAENNATFTPIAGVGKDITQYIDKNISSNSQYTYRIIAVNSPENYSQTSSVSTETVYCNNTNTCNGFGLTPTRIALKSNDETLVDLNTISCGTAATAVNYQHATLLSNSTIELEVKQSNYAHYYYNVFIDLDNNGSYDDENEWIFKNEISTSHSSFVKRFNLDQFQTKQGVTAMRIICSFYVEGDDSLLIEGPCSPQLSFTQDITFTLDGPSKQITWTGTEDNNWFNVENWSNNTIPSNESDIIISNEALFFPTINQSIDFNTLTVEAGATLISNTEIEGSILYEKEIIKNEWALITSPVQGKSIQSFTELNKVLVSGDKISLASFDIENNDWNYFSTSTNDSLKNGIGYAVKLDEDKKVKFKGKSSYNSVSIYVQQGVATTKNLIGNPYLAYLSTAEFIAKNASYINEETVWVWNGSKYSALNYLTPIDISPAEGFFIDVKTNGTIKFDSSDLYHKTNAPEKQQTFYSVELIASTATQENSSKLFFVEGKTTGFDNGYDSSVFDADSDLLIYSKMPIENSSKKLEIQALPYSESSEFVIPLGFNNKNKEQITLAAKNLNIPDQFSVLLEDRLNNIFIDLRKDSFTINSNEEFISDRFYIHFKQKTLTVTNTDINTVEMYKSADNEISIKNLESKATIKVYSMQGSLVMTKEVLPATHQKIALQNMSDGIYIFHVTTENAFGIKKIKI